MNWSGQFRRMFFTALLVSAVQGATGAAGQSQYPAGGRGITVPAADASAPPAPVDAVAMVGLTVSDMDRSVAFYRDALTFEVVSDELVEGAAYGAIDGLGAVRARVVRLQLGDERLQLTQYLTPAGRPAPAGARSNDRWFQHVAIIVSDMERAYSALAARGIERVSPAPQRLPDWNPNAGGIEAFYFRDPDGHPLEILHFPPGKGDPKWQRAEGRLFLGIDHTAIVVRDTEKSLAFYRDLLGMRIAGRSENYGPEQEKLNNVAGARLRITALRAPQGPGVEFLQYVTPTDGKPYPGDARSNDLIHWETVVATGNLAGAAQTLRARGQKLVTRDVIALPGPALGYRKALLIRDPDGHAIQLVEP